MQIDEEIWVFLSHSHKDFENVSLVRNLLEERGYRPILFYLKCLDDNSEIDNLIKREIDCRAYFILCDSKNSRLSTWVREEENYIKSKGRIYEIIDIESDVSQIKAAISRFERRTSAFISCSLRDAPISRSIERSLEANGYTILGGKEMIPIVSSYSDTIKDLIKKSSNEGFVVILLSENYLQASMCLYELKMALGERGTNTSSILLVSIDGTKPHNLPELKDIPVRWIETNGCGLEQIGNKVVSFFNFYNTSYRRVYNLCWELSKLKYDKIEYLQEIPYPLPDNIDKTKVACRYILGLDVPTDINYAITLLREAEKQGDENATKILETI